MIISESGSWQTNSVTPSSQGPPELTISSGRLSSELLARVGFKSLAYEARKCCERIYKSGKENVHAVGALLTASL